MAGRDLWHPRPSWQWLWAAAAIRAGTFPVPCAWVGTPLRLPIPLFPKAGCDLPPWVTGRRWGCEGLTVLFTAMESWMAARLAQKLLKYPQVQTTGAGGSWHPGAASLPLLGRLVLAGCIPGRLFLNKAGWQQGWGCLCPVMGSELPSGFGKPGLLGSPRQSSPGCLLTPPTDLQLSSSSSIGPVVTSSSAAKSGALGDIVLVPPHSWQCGWGWVPPPSDALSTALSPLGLGLILRFLTPQELKQQNELQHLSPPPPRSWSTAHDLLPARRLPALEAIC